MKAHAKLNLALVVGPTRDDGPHEVVTVLQRLELADEVTLEAAERLVVDGFAEDTLVRAALESIATAGGVEPRWRARIEKRIPVAGGLGGGSSDAATVLVALNQLWQLRLSVDELARIGLTLGADVPFFVRGSAAWAEGVGEQLTPYDFPEQHYLIVKPQAAVSTAEVFQAPELTRNSPVTTIRGFLAAGGHNDCTACVRGRYPEIAEALDWLQEFGEARLTGTGACVFVALPDEHTARAVRARLPARWSGYVVRGLNRSPLLSRVTDR
jgi:4-diphosphocytidyl-2-C-methyl-D-erythritol kinase